MHILGTKNRALNLQCSYHPNNISQTNDGDSTCFLCYFPGPPHIKAVLTEDRVKIQKFER